VKGVLLLTLVKEALLLALVKVLLVGVGFDEVGAGFDEEGRVGGYAKTQGGRGRSKPYSPPLLKRSFSPGSPVEFNNPSTLLLQLSQWSFRQPA